MRRGPIAFLLGILALGVTGCRGGAPDDIYGVTPTVEPRPEAMRAAGWLDFADLSLHTDAEPEPPRRPFIRGWILGGRFEPTGEVEGVMDAAPPRRRVSRGWLEVRTLAFFAESNPRAPQPPLIRGCRDEETGGFYPLSALSWAVDPASPGAPVTPPSAPGGR